MVEMSRQEKLLRVHDESVGQSPIASATLLQSLSNPASKSTTAV
jgi:hypothetical protein